MLGNTPGIYWVVTFAIVPVLTFVTKQKRFYSITIYLSNFILIVYFIVLKAVLIVFTIQLIQDPVVKLNDYEYPAGAQVIGWLIVVIVICPIPICFVLHWLKKRPQLNKQSLIEVDINEKINKIKIELEL